MKTLTIDIQAEALFGTSQLYCNDDIYLPRAKLEEKIAARLIFLQTILLEIPTEENVMEKRIR